MKYDADRSLLERLFWPIIVPSADVLLGLGITGLSLAVGLWTSGVARALFAAPLVLFLSGYAVVSALFPAAVGSTDHAAPGLGARAALAFGTSVAILPLLGLVVSVTGLGFTAPVVLGATASITVGGLLVASRRRVHLSRDRRFRLPVRQWESDLVSGVFDSDSRTDGALNGAVLLAVLVATSALAYGVFVPAGSTGFASFSVLTEDASGELVAGGYPTDLVEGEGAELVLAVENHDRQPEEYAVVAELQRFDPETQAVVERAEVDRLTRRVPAGERVHLPLTLTPSLTGQDLRVAFYLYPEQPPEVPDVTSAREHLFLWVNVSASGGTAGNESLAVTPAPPA